MRPAVRVQLDDPIDGESRDLIVGYVELCATLPDVWFQPVPRDQLKFVLVDSDTMLGFYDRCYEVICRLILLLMQLPESSSCPGPYRSSKASFSASYEEVT